MTKTVNFSTYLTNGYTLTAVVSEYGIGLSGEFANGQTITYLDELINLTANDAKAIAEILKAAATEFEAVNV